MDMAVVGGKKIRYWDLMKNGWKYELADDYAINVPIYPESDISYPKNDPWVSLTKTGLLWFREHFCYDGASGPTWDSPCTMRGALVHDGLYQLMRAGLLGMQWRESADILLRDICKQDGMWGFRANLWYWAVRRAAGPAAKPGHDVADDIKEAP